MKKEKNVNVKVSNGKENLRVSLMHKVKNFDDFNQRRETMRIQVGSQEPSNDALSKEILRLEKELVTCNVSHDREVD